MGYEIERNITYGQTIIDFINAETTDEGCLKLIENIKNLQGFSAHFINKARKGFPFLSTYTSVPEREKKLFDLLFKEKKLLNKVGGSLAYIMAEFISYDPHKKTLTYSLAPPIAPMNSKKIEYSEPCEELISDLEKKLTKEFSLLGDVYPEYKNWHFEEAYELAKVGKAIIELTNTISETRYFEIKDMSDNYAKIISGHKSIQKHQKALGKILTTIVNGKNPFRTKLFKRFIQEYNKFCKVKVSCSSAGFLFSELLVPGEDSYLNFEMKEGSESDQWFEPYRMATIYSLIEFFRSLGSNEWKKIKECPYCNKLFIAKDTRRNKCYSNDCCN